ncbi:hypothetical protein DIPPA_05211 [Diplonema papillatum]|nr:hypothetical protein DIPPA_05211 [Diplonema papillatum]
MTAPMSCQAMQLVVEFDSQLCRVEVDADSSAGSVRAEVLKAAGLEKDEEAYRRQAAQVWFGNRVLGDSVEPAAGLGIAAGSVLRLVAPLGVPVPHSGCGSNAFEYIRVSRGFATLGCCNCQEKLRLRNTCLRFWRCFAQMDDGHCTKGSACPKMHLHIKKRKNGDSRPTATAYHTADSTGGSAITDSSVGPDCRAHATAGLNRAANHAQSNADRTADQQRTGFSACSAHGTAADAVHTAVSHIPYGRSVVAAGAADSCNHALRSAMDTRSMDRAASHPGSPPTMDHRTVVDCAVAVDSCNRTVQSAMDTRLMDRAASHPAHLPTMDHRTVVDCAVAVDACSAMEAFTADHTTDRCSTQGLSCSASEACDETDAPCASPLECNAAPPCAWFRYEPYGMEPGFQHLVIQLAAK